MTNQTTKTIREITLEKEIQELEDQVNRYHQILDSFRYKMQFTRETLMGFVVNMPGFQMKKEWFYSTFETMPDADGTPETELRRQQGFAALALYDDFGPEPHSVSQNFVDLQKENHALRLSHHVAMEKLKTHNIL